MAAITRRVQSRDTNIWPGFVDALATLLMVIIFVLMIFIVAQFYLTQLLSGRDAALDEIRRQVLELSEILLVERETSERLREERAQLSAELQSAISANDIFSSRISELTNERDELADQYATALAQQASLRRKIAEIDAERNNLDFRIVQLVNERDALLAKLRAVEEEAHLAKIERDDFAAKTADASQIIEANQETIELQLRDLEALRRDIAALEKVRTDLETRVVELLAVQSDLEQQLGEEVERVRLSAADLEEARTLLRDLTGKLASERTKSSELTAQVAERDASMAELTALLSSTRDSTKALEVRLEVAERRTTLAQKQVEDRDIRLEELLSSHTLIRDELTASQKLSATAQREVERLNRQLLALRKQLAVLDAALNASTELAKEQDVKIIDLSKRLNAALLTRVQELARFRSEFFGRLREVLKNRRDIRIVGDRFIFQAEVLFASGSADVARAGRGELRRLAQALNQITPKIPKNIDWILQVEGHTDRVPISNDQFRNNWELSAGRAISVVEYLIRQGVPPYRLSATGYGEYQPVDKSAGSVSDSRNRRIEMKLTQR